MADGEEDTSSGDSTDATSGKFDSLKALYSEKTPIPVPNAPIFDNVHKFESVVLKGTIVKPSGSGTARKKEGESSQRRFLPHQEPVRVDNSERHRRFAAKNVLNRMHRMLGPLGVLFQYMENRTRVKVYTRNATGIRGHIEAFVVAFDRHWNLALEDCLENWTRKVKKKAPALGDSAERVPLPSSFRTIVKQRDGKVEVLERHVAQLLIRGEQVALIAKID